MGLETPATRQNLKDMGFGISTMLWNADIAPGYEAILTVGISPLGYPRCLAVCASDLTYVALVNFMTSGISNNSHFKIQLWLAETFEVPLVSH